MLNLNPARMHAPVMFGSRPWTDQDAIAIKQAAKDKNLIFVDVDTQRDFVVPSDRPRQGLYVPNAVQLLPTFDKINALAKQHGISIVATQDTHTPDDPEFEVFKAISDSHCVNGSRGWEKVIETAQPDAWTIGVDANPADMPGEETLKRMLTKGEPIVIQKNTYSVFNGNSLATPLFNKFKELGVKTAIVYGVATDFCVKGAVEGLKALGIRPIIVKDAVKPVVDDCLANPSDPVYGDLTEVAFDTLQAALDTPAN